MENRQINALNKLIGVTKSYKGKNLSIKKFVDGDGIVTVHTTAGIMNFTHREVDEFLNDLDVPLTPVEVVAAEKARAAQSENVPAAVPAPNVAVGLPVGAVTSESVELTSLLMATIKGVADGSVPLDRAKVVFEGSNAMVGVMKTQIQMIRATKSTRR